MCRSRSSLPVPSSVHDVSASSEVDAYLSCSDRPSPRSRCNVRGVRRQHAITAATACPDGARSGRPSGTVSRTFPFRRREPAATQRGSSFRRSLFRVARSAVRVGGTRSPGWSLSGGARSARSIRRRRDVLLPSDLVRDDPGADRRTGAHFVHHAARRAVEENDPTVHVAVITRPLAVAVTAARMGVRV